MLLNRDFTQTHPIPVPYLSCSKCFPNYQYFIFETWLDMIFSTRSSVSLHLLSHVERQVHIDGGVGKTGKLHFVLLGPSIPSAGGRGSKCLSIMFTFNSSSETMTVDQFPNACDIPEQNFHGTPPPPAPTGLLLSHPPLNAPQDASSITALPFFGGVTFAGHYTWPARLLRSN